MPDTQVVVFGNPKSGTPLMLASPIVALDLPLRVLVADDGGHAAEAGRRLQIDDRHPVLRVQASRNQRSMAGWRIALDAE
jgi:uncharacterized protein (DUF302 family)